MAAVCAVFYSLLVHLFFLAITTENITSYNSSTTISPDQNSTLNFTEADTSTEPTQFESTTPTSTSSRTEPPEPELPDDPLPMSGHLLQPTTSVAEVCPCDENRDICDMNCCCDRECGLEVALFTDCSVHTVRGSEKLCNREVASYSLATTIDGFSELQSSVQNEKNYDTFCIYSHNRGNGLSHPPPALPTDRNFDLLFEKFSSFTFSSERSQTSAVEPQTSSGHQYGDIMSTSVGNDQRDIFYLPSSGITMDCVDTNPAAFLHKQSSRCSRRVDLLQDCEHLAALRMDTYTSIQIYSDKTTNAVPLPVDVASIVLQSLEGTQTEVQFSEGENLLPVLVSPGLCANVVLEVVYNVKYNPAGKIVNVAASLVLGFVRDAPMPFEQAFEITFSPEDGPEVVVQFSGNPGYVVGMPLVSGYKTQNILSS
uniref:Tectonic domain-containing protein n=1 Tax=Neogobius melanostomus TaxID=47308 RepID=A0A8C6WHL2_9GOBI